MSRKQIFGNLSQKPTDQTRDTVPAVSQEDQGPRRPSRLRPLLGSPDLTDPSDATPVGALGQSLGELSERSKRADEIEKKLLSGQIIVELDTADEDWQVGIQQVHVGVIVEGGIAQGHRQRVELDEPVLRGRKPGRRVGRKRLQCTGDLACAKCGDAFGQQRGGPA